MTEEAERRVQEADRDDLKALVGMAWDFHEMDEDEVPEGQQEAYREFLGKVKDLGLEWYGEATDFSVELSDARYGLEAADCELDNSFILKSKRGYRYLCTWNYGKGREDDTCTIRETEAFRTIGTIESTTPPEDTEMMAAVIEEHENPEGYDEKDFQIFGVYEDD